MESSSWFIVLVTLCLCFILKSVVGLVFPSKNKSKKLRLPPGPPKVPIISSLLWLRKSFGQLEPILRDLHAKYGPIISLPIASRPSISIADPSLAHEALIKNGSVISNRSKALATNNIITSNQHNIASAFYGPTWRLLRRNLTSVMLHPSRINSYSHVRNWVLHHILLNRLKSDSESGNKVKVVHHFQHAMFSLLAFMCFGDKLEEKQIKEIEDVQRRLLLRFGRFNFLNFWPRITKVVFRKHWEQLLQLRKDQEHVLILLIEARKKAKEERLSKEEDEFVVSYVDTLLNLQLPEEKRQLNQGEMVSLCSEFLNGGTDTTSTTLQWIMANLVKYPQIQKRIVHEIREVMGDREEKEFVKEQDLNKLPYLKAVILEGLRRHPPGHFMMPHAVTEDVVLNGYLIPKNGTVNFMVAEIGWDPKVWEDPMAFKPERFLSSEAFDITGSKEIKMMPFGAGRRICPGLSLAMLHLEYFVANLVWSFEWKAAEGDDIDLSEKEEFTVGMKNPLHALISPRSRRVVV